MKLHLYEFDLPLRHVFTISRGSVAVQKTMIVDLEARRPARVRRGDDQSVLRSHALRT